MGVHKRGDHYVIDYYFDGKRVRETIGPNRRQAEQVLTQRKADILNEKFKLPTEGKATFGEAAERYLAWSQEHKRSWRNDVSMIKYLLDEIGDVPLEKLNAWTVEQIKHHLLKKGLSGPRVNRYLACLSGLFHRAQEWGLVTENPIRRVHRYRENPGRIRYLSEEEIMHLLAACESELRPVVLMALTTGMRRGEIFALLWQDVDLVHGIIHVVDSKNSQRRDIPVCPELEKELFSLRRESVGVRVFAKPDGLGYTAQMRKAWMRTCNQAGLTSVRFHDLRHTFASHLVMAGKSLLAVQELLGHRTLAMTRRYSHLAPGVMREAIGVMGELVGRQSQREWSQIGHTVEINGNRNLEKASDLATLPR